MQTIKRNAAAALALGFMLAVPAQADDLDFEASWSHGLGLATEDGSTKIKIGLQIQNDWIFHRADDEVVAATGVDPQDGTEFRRLRLVTSGTIQHTGVFKLQLDFAGGKPQVKDAYAGIQKIPGVGSILVGDQYEPFGLETQTSSRYITFLERSLANGLAPERNSGILATNWSDRATWALGIFRETDGFGTSTGDGEYAGTGRVAVRLQNADEGRKLVHVGVAGSLRHPPGDTVQYSQTPENHLAPKYVSTGTLAADRVRLVGLEAATVQGPVSVQGEFMQSRVSSADNTDPSFRSFYVVGSVFLTGEHRPFKPQTATFDRVKPRRPYDGKGGAGAWEVAARFSRMDLEDEAIAGGELDDVTAALNWYPNANLRWMLDYVRADLSDVGVSHALLTRFQADF
ncbi:MAG: OprO/OprP family phosphate-selective porin [Candidatus Eiseniibacteriota bacterium]